MNSGIRISDNVLSQEVAGETVLLDLASESYFGLDEVGTRVWQMLKQGMGREAITEVDGVLVPQRFSNPDPRRPTPTAP